MKKVLAILALALTIERASSNPAVLTNDTMVSTYSDSFGRASFGQRQIFYIASYYICYYPQYFVAYRDHSRSGGNNGGMLELQLPQYGIPDAIASFGITNQLNIFWVSGNGGFNSNAIYGFFQEMFQYPTNSYTTNGVLVHDWTQPNPAARYDSFAIGDVPYINLSPASSNYSAGAFISALANGRLFVNTFANMIGLVTTYNGDKNILWFPNGVAFDHPNNVFQFIWAMKTLTNPTNSSLGIGVDTNTYSCTIDFNAAVVRATNHCVISSIDLTGNTLTINFTADRMAPGFYVPNGVMTNDCRPAFEIAPETGSAFNELFTITNLPAGTYNMVWDSAYTNIVSSAQLAAGLNNFTNFNNPLWIQKILVLSNLCNMMQVSFATASDQVNIGNNQLMVNYESIARTIWPTNAPGVDNYASRMESTFHTENALFGIDKTNHTTVQQASHTIKLTPITITGYAPAPFQ